MKGEGEEEIRNDERQPLPRTAIADGDGDSKQSNDVMCAGDFVRLDVTARKPADAEWTANTRMKLGHVSKAIRRDAGRIVAQECVAGRKNRIAGVFDVANGERSVGDQHG